VSEWVEFSVSLDT